MAAKAQAAVDTLNRSADVVARSTEFRAVAPECETRSAPGWTPPEPSPRPIAERYGQQEFNAEVDKFNHANDNALDMCGGSPLSNTGR